MGKTCTCQMVLVGPGEAVVIFQSERSWNLIQSQALRSMRWFDERTEFASDSCENSISTEPRSVYVFAVHCAIYVVAVKFIATTSKVVAPLHLRSSRHWSTSLTIDSSDSFHRLGNLGICLEGGYLTVRSRMLFSFPFPPKREYRFMPRAVQNKASYKVFSARAAAFLSDFPKQ
eukprot:1991184-Amphidinium_carterae.1